MRPSIRILISFILLMQTAACLHAQQPGPSVFGRKYREGETYRYKLTSEQFYGGVWTATTVAICELKVSRDINGIYYDMVRWISMQHMRPKDTLDQTPHALKVIPYRISLDPRGKLEIPKIKEASMTGPITDFNTFLVAVSPQLGATKLSRQGESQTNPQPVTGNFANGSTILKGLDCLQTSVQLEEIHPDHVVITTHFLPPAQPCLSYLLPEMDTPVVKDTLNNFQMVVPVGKDRFNIQYGREYFIIRSIVRKSDGKITVATMNNVLTLKLKYNCNGQYKDCKGEFPFTIERKLTLELLPGSALRAPL
jgi:hypothetical protein